MIQPRDMALAMLLVVACAPLPAVRPSCPPGTFPKAVDTDASQGGGVGASASVPTQTGRASGSWRGAGSVDWRCARLCREGTLWRRVTGPGGAVTEECVPVPVAARPAS